MFRLSPNRDGDFNDPGEVRTLYDGLNAPAAGVGEVTRFFRLAVYGE